MQEFLGGLLTELAVDVAHDEIPVSEIEGAASHRTAADSTRKRSSGPREGEGLTSAERARRQR